VALNGHGNEDATLQIKYNASGVDLERDDGKASSLILGQWISELTVTSKNAEANLKLLISNGENGNMKWNYESKPLQGKGQFVYKKGDPTASQ